MADGEIKTRPSHVLEDPGAQAVARTYAGAFVAAAQSSGVDDALEEFGSFLTDVLEQNPEFDAILTSGIVSREEKLGVIDRTVAPVGSELFTNFLRVLARHDRLDLLSLILSEAQLQHERTSGRKRVTVRSARPLSDASRSGIEGRLREVFGFEPIIEEQVDESLIGGLVIYVDDTVYDSSLRTRMKQLRESLRERALNEIQSGRDRFSNSEGN